MLDSQDSVKIKCSAFKIALKTKCSVFKISSYIYIYINIYKMVLRLPYMWPKFVCDLDHDLEVAHMRGQHFVCV